VVIGGLCPLSVFRLVRLLLASCCAGIFQNDGATAAHTHTTAAEKAQLALPSTTTSSLPCFSAAPRLDPRASGRLFSSRLNRFLGLNKRVVDTVHLH